MAARTPRATSAKPAAPQPLFIEFPLTEGGVKRRMQVRIPTPEQLAVWQSIGETFTRHAAEWAHQSAAVADLPADHPDAVAVRVTQNRQAQRGLGRSLKLIKTVLVNEHDHDWVDDMLMEGATIERLLGIVTLTVDEMRKMASDKNSASATGRKLAKAALAE